MGHERDPFMDRPVNLPEQAPDPAGVGMAPRVEEDPENIMFRIHVALDAERERNILYAAIIVIELIVAAILAREWLLWYLEI